VRVAVSLAMLCVLVLAGCDRAPVEPRTLHYFETHADDRKSVIDQCKNSDRQYQPQEECGAALNADYIVSMKQDNGAKVK